MKLLEKRTGKVKFSPIISRIPLVPVPTLPAVNGLVELRRILGDGSLAAEAALSRIEELFVALRETALLAAVRTERWWWNRLLLPIEDRRDPVVEGEIIRSDFK
jgi:hypothetical protein